MASKHPDERMGQIHTNHAWKRNVAYWFTRP